MSEAPPPYPPNQQSASSIGLGAAPAPRPRAEDLGRGPKQATARRTSPRGHSNSPPPPPPLTCPLCPDSRAELFQHIRKNHAGYPFLGSDFPPGVCQVCTQCGVVTKPDAKAMTVHRGRCKGLSARMRERWRGGTPHDQRQRSVPSSTSTTPLRPTVSAPAMGPPPSTPLRRATSNSSIARPPTPALPPSPGLQLSRPPTPALPPPPSPHIPPTLPPSPHIPTTAPPPPANPHSPAPTAAALPTAGSADDSPWEPKHDLSDLLHLPGSIKHLHPGLVRPFVACASRLAQAYNDEPSSERLFEILALVKVGLVPALRNGHAEVKNRLADFPKVPWPLPPDSSRHSRPATVRAKELVEAGLVGKAERTLMDDVRIARITEETVAALQAKHPQGSDNPFDIPLPSQAPLPVAPEPEDIERIIRRFKPDTAPGPSGWSVKLMTLAATDAHFKTFLTGLTSQIAAGVASGQEMLCTARLTPLLKPDGGIRPIAVGEMFYRLAMKAIFASNFDPSSLAPCQFGVGTKGGVEPIVRAVQFTVDGHPSFPYRFVVSLDAKNAFNAFFRQVFARAVTKYCPSLLRLAAWSYNTPSPLLIKAEEGTYEIASQEGFRQGDPLGPFFFSVGARDTVEELQALLGPDYLVIAYLDDIFILAPDDKALPAALSYFNREGSPLTLNPAKCKQMSVEQIREEGMELLGSCVGPPAVRRAFLSAKIDSLEADLEKIHSLPRQHALLILRQSLQHKLRHLQRSLATSDISDLWRRLDDALWGAFDRIRGIPAPASVGDRDRAIISLPPSMGGLGLTSHFDTAPLAYQAATAMAIGTLLPLVPTLEEQPNPVTQRELCREAFTTKKNDLLASLHLRDRVCMVEAASQLGRKWLSAIPSAARFTVPDHAIQSNLCYRTLLPGYQGKCRRCPLPNTVGHDEWCKGRKDYRVSRHEAVKHHLAGGLRHIPSAIVTVEPYMETRTNRRNDIKVTIDDGSDRPIVTEEYDLKVVSLLAPTHLASVRSTGRTRAERDAAEIAEQAGTIMANTESRMVKVLGQQASRKISALPATFSSPFAPLVISTGGLQDKDTKDKIAEWKKWKMPGASYSWMLTSVSVALAKARGRTFLGSP